MNVQSVSIVLKNNGYVEIPEALYECRALEILHLGTNQIAALSEKLCGLTNLRELILGNNRLKKMPAELSKLTHLRKLHLGSNEMGAVRELLELESLEELWLGTNHIREIPEKIRSLKNLKILHLGDNLIEKLPDSIIELDGLTIFLNHCPRSVIPEGFKGTVFDKQKLKQSIEESLGK
jgi:Leucine-rich repeat (LRR) protein